MAFDISPSIIFMGVTGSHAYGTARKTSDVDVRGCCIAPRRYRMSPFRKFEQATDSDPKFWGEVWKPLREGLEAHPTASQSLAHDPDQTLDIVAYDVAKLVKLCRLTNPNMLELLFLEEQDIIISSSLWEKLAENRELFLSKAVKHSYCGYAHSQLKRIKGHRAWLLNPPKKKPTREDFDLPETTVLGADIRNRLDEAIKKIVRDWGVEDGLDDYIKGAAQDVLRERMRDFQATALQCKDDMLDDKLYELGAASLGLSKDVLYALKQERSYRAALKDYKQYEAWKRERNPVRAEMEAKFGYDCYSADTEFLTENGWKLFDQIKEGEKLATVYIGPTMTVRKFGAVEYQAPTERFQGSMTGTMYRFFGHHTETLVTPNHRMLYRQVSRKLGETYDVVLEEAAQMPDSFDFLRTVTPRTKRYESEGKVKGFEIPPEALMRLMGWYLSDGTVGTRKNKSGVKVKDIRISQKLGGRLCQSLTKFHQKYKEQASCSVYEQDKEGLDGKIITEKVLSVRDRHLRSFLVEECGRLKQKRIPRWVFSQSKRLMEMLFKAMCAGDGTVRPTSKESDIYYTSLKGLADDVNELAFHCGWETSLWGPYKNETELSTEESVMYHVHVDTKAAQFQRFNRRNIERVPVEDQGFVCFSVPNGTLVTRRLGRIGIHGNCKHAGHLIRLLRTGSELLRGEGLKVRRDDAEELLAIRNGSLSYDELIEMAECLDQDVAEAYKTSALPHRPNEVALEMLLIEVLDQFYQTEV